MNRKAFTLIELLVVIAIIVGLLGITLPALRLCKQRALSLSCTSNLHQLSMALNAYANDYISYPYGFSDLPGMRSLPPEGYAGNATMDWMGRWWSDSIDQVIKSSTMMDCPGSKEDWLYKNLCGNYGVNYSICKIASLSSKETECVGKPLQPTQVRHPSEVILVMDAGYSLISWKAAASDPSIVLEIIKRRPWFYVPGLTSVNEQITIDSEKIDDALTGRHPGNTVNIGFCDGHVSALDAEALAVERLPDAQTKPNYRYWSP